MGQKDEIAFGRRVVRVVCRCTGGLGRFRCELNFWVKGAFGRYVFWVKIRPYFDAMENLERFPVVDITKWIDVFSIGRNTDRHDGKECF